MKLLIWYKIDINLYGTRVPRPTWATNFNPIVWPMVPTPLFEAGP